MNFYNKIKQLTSKYIPLQLSNNYDARDSLFKCTSCGNTFLESIHHIMRAISPSAKNKKYYKSGICPYCEITRKNVSLSEAQYKFNISANNEYKLVQYSGKMKDKSKVEHTLCGHTYDVSLVTFISGERRCPYCFKDEKYSIDQVSKLISEANKDYELVSKEYGGIGSKIEIKHNMCGNTYNVTLHNYLSGSRCPYCWKKIGRSRGEAQILKFLTNRNIEFEEQKTFLDLKYKRSLKYDFYIESLNLCIEYDGIQHFIDDEYITHGDTTKFESQKVRDKIKTEYCKKKSINLLRIKYTVSPKKVFSFLDDFINNKFSNNDKKNIFYNDFENDEYFE